MAQISDLLSRMPEFAEVRMAAMGHTLWVCWQNKPDPTVRQTLFNYGGMPVCEDDEQALWFFFTDDAFLALARLMVWANFNELSVSMELFPGRLQLGRKREANLLIDGSLHGQMLLAAGKLDIWVHPKSREDKKGLPGISFEPSSGRQGMSRVDWASMAVDVRMPFVSSRAWFAIVHPLGSPLDKNFQAGWPAMFQRLESLLQKHKIKFLEHEGFVMLSVDNLLMLRTFMHEYLSSFDKENAEGAHWPCACVVADRNNLNFNVDLPKKIGLQWDSLMPDFPYLSYRNAYLLGEGFTVRDLRYSSEQKTVDDWCNVVLDENRISARTLPLLMAGQLTAPSPSGVGCVYCGLPGHEAAACPTRCAKGGTQAVWEDLDSLSLEAINEGFREIEQNLMKEGLAGYEALMARKDAVGTVMRAVLNLNGICQLRNVADMWRHGGREPRPGDKAQPQDESPAWDLLEKLMKTAPEGLSDMEKKINQAIPNYQRDPRLRMLQGFVLLERNDFTRAAASFRDAAMLTPSQAVQAWNELLQARLNEEQGRYTAAIAQYAQIFRAMPQWRGVRYREILCKIKMGFAESVLEQLAALIQEDRTYFNRALVDPALERGRLLVLGRLYDIWDEARKKAEAVRVRINAMESRLNAWFAPEHPARASLDSKLKYLGNLSNTNNYSAFLRVVEECPGVEKELEEQITNEIETLRGRYMHCLEVLQEIRDEASWFPFPTALREFSANFNESAGIINRAFSSNFNKVESFLAAQEELPRLVRLLKRLRRRLRTLRLVRDGTLFGLTMAKTALWVESAGLLLCFAGVPAVVFWGDSLGLGWLREIIGSDPWSIQKVLLLIVTVVALGVAALRSTLVFERKREQLLENARQQREQAQQDRLEKVRRQRRAQAESARRAEAVVAGKEIRRQLEDREEAEAADGKDAS